MADNGAAVTGDLNILDRPAPLAPAGRLKRIQEKNAALNVWTVVLDDDPTGTQSVRDVPVLAGKWTERHLRTASYHPSRMTFVLTNSRSLQESSARRLTYDTVSTAARVARQRGLKLRVVSRSDSTLRGHFAAEIEAAHEALAAEGKRATGTLFVPAFLEAGRFTADNVQWVNTALGFVPAAHTEFAQDSTFGYGEVDLAEWVTARTGTSVAPCTISLGDLRAHACGRTIGRRLSALNVEQVAIANAIHAEDLESLMLGLLASEESGRSLVVRSGPSFVRLCAGQPPSEALHQRLSDASSAKHGLVVVGSHTDLTNAQVQDAIQNHSVERVVLDADAVIEGGSIGDAEVERCAAAVERGLTEKHVLLTTSRRVLTSGRATPLDTSAAIADALVDTVISVATSTDFRFLVAKGGITSSDMAVRALGVCRADVAGQMLPGLVPVWDLVDGLKPGLPYIVFPGNVGSVDTLAHVLTALEA